MWNLSNSDSDEFETEYTGDDESQDFGEGSLEYSTLRESASYPNRHGGYASRSRISPTPGVRGKKPLRLGPTLILNDPAGPNARHSTSGGVGEPGSGTSRLTPSHAPKRSRSVRSKRDGSNGKGDSGPRSQPIFKTESATPQPIVPVLTIDDLQPRQVIGQFEKAVFEGYVTEAKYIADGSFQVKVNVPERSSCDEAEKLGKTFGIMLTVAVYRKRYARSHPEEL